ncbi:hypothetical protein HYFRA_00007050 [Hymenoscyphus fraxineus]|uniref:Rhodopsin domain-containing protein n=1 Tax=Hymenoscyphus fraxineus TaxID=746836 RepID=A0A9N9KXU0_9HELO|nr:hypothetical protein HYFRA_00007050 [Hymenoscyphus fraxineus]
MYTGVTRGAQVTGIAVMALFLTWLSFSLRLYVRTRLLKFFGREDWLMVASMILLSTLCALCLRSINYGLGAHMYNIPPTDKEIGFKYIFICEFLYVSCTAVTKLSIGVYFLRLSSKRYQIWTIYSTLVIVMMISTMYFFFLLFQCMPINYLWSQWEGGQGKCLHGPILANVTYAHATMSALTDWAFGILPIFFVYGMVMNPRTKFSIILILSLGFFASSATIVRIIYIRSLTLTDDWSWEGINLVKWSMVEPAIAITASNIATLRPLVKNSFFFARRRFDSDLDSDGRPSYDSTYTSKSENRTRPQEYSAEFAEMLGLTKVGVTTEISANNQPEKPRPRRPFSMAREKSDSELQLNEQTEEMDWSFITATTVVTREVK